MHRRFIGLAIPSLLLFGGCGVRFEAELHDVQVSRKNLKVQGVPAGMLPEGNTWPVSFAVSSEEMSWAKRMDSDVRVHRLWIASSDNSVNLAFIRQLRISVADSVLPSQAVQVVLIDRAGTTQDGGAIESSLNPAVDITHAWNAPKTLVTAEFSGQIPEQDWLVDLTLTVSGKITELD